MDRGVSSCSVAEIRLGSGSVPVVGFVESLPYLLAVLGDGSLRGRDAAGMADHGPVAAMFHTGRIYFLSRYIAPCKAFTGLGINLSGCNAALLAVGAFMRSGSLPSSHWTVMAFLAAHLVLDALSVSRHVCDSVKADVKSLVIPVVLVLA